ncbi:MAG: ABC transporter substrate-binding protein [Gemmatales bacterium]|nr:ABC transporter substrate-binding protein [Gemmatales bacterium]MDW8385621.1 ABC transporter substrate-binding protein [Gemmatales bacterium]
MNTRRLLLTANAIWALMLPLAWAVDDEEEEVRPRRPATPAATQPMPTPPATPATPRVDLRLGQTISLTEEAKKAEHPALKKLLEDFSVIHDTIVSQTGRVYKVQPLKNRYDPNTAADVSFVELNAGTQRQTLSREQIRSVSHYEIRALAEVRNLLQSGLDQPTAQGITPVSRFRLLQVGEWVLREALRFHTSAKSRNDRVGRGWDGVEDELRNELTKLQLAQIRALTGAGDYAAAEQLGAYLLKQYKGSREVLDALEKVFTTQADEAISQGNHARARELMEHLLRSYNSEVTPGVERIHRILQTKARELVAQSDQAAAQGNGNQALVLLEEAQRIWPKLDGLAEKRRLIARLHPTLRIGVRTLPSQMSPTTAESDSDRLAVRLLFDRLVELRGGPSARDGYAYKLGPEPELKSDGVWEFTLPSDIQWSDGKPFTVKDVLRSFEIAKDPATPYYDPQLRELVDIKPLDDYRFVVTFRQGHMDPLALLTFELLPAHLLLPDRTPRNLAFGKAPVGTGPYVFAGIEGKEAIFRANPNYRRPHAPTGPAIQEIRLVQYDDIQQARQALANGTLHLLTDFTTKERDALTGIPQVDLLDPTQPRDQSPPYLANGRVYWLAPNFRQKAMQNLDLRLAISYAIDRERILNEVFRGKDRKYHQVLNGPFPLNSWAYNPALTPDRESPYKPEAARNHVARARQSLGNLPSLKIRFATNEPLAAEAVQQIANQLKSIDLTVQVEGIPYQQLLAELAGDRPQFDLLYWRHDFENETLNLWPLFDPQGIGPRGRNFMGFERDSQVEGRFRELQQHRDFGFIREKAQMLHDLLTLQKMVLIPLWQLDRHVAVHRNLRPTRIHPHHIVEDIELWQLRVGD